MTTHAPDRHVYLTEFYGLREEVLNSATHCVATVLAVAALVGLVWSAEVRGTPWHVAGYSIYGITLISLFLTSTIYHMVQHTPLRCIFRRIDHAVIYIFIAGCYTPFALIALRGPLGWTILGLIWLLALAGILFKIWFINRWVVLSTLGYVAMGWLGVVAFPRLVDILPHYGMVFLIAGGAVYMLGIFFYVLERIPYNHAIWHVCIMVASACHFVAVYSLIQA